MERKAHVDCGKECSLMKGQPRKSPKARGAGQVGETETETDRQTDRGGEKGQDGKKPFEKNDLGK
jgi:hypothetical protein